MCGIAGFVDKKNTLAPIQRESLIKKMLATIKHRGPDDDGVWIEGSVAMTQARLSIIDVSRAGHQPMKSDDGRNIIVFNGEIYNHRDVRKEVSSTRAYRSHSDTETILRSYEAWQKKCLSHLKGMFAFALADLERNEIFIAVDRFSIKPLYYIETPEWFAWGSELKALLLLPGMKHEINTAVLGEQALFRSIAGRETLLKDIYKMLPGESMVFSLSSATLQREIYWSPHSAPYPFKDTNRAGEIEELLEKSVAEHLLADVPVGLQLSGGVDSSLVAALARKHVPADQELHSFSIGLAEPEWNEFPYSRQVAQLLGTTHHELLFTEQEFCEALPFATYHYDEPINHAHSVPMMLLAQHAKTYVKVLLSGEGADEVFGGYRRYGVLFDNHTPTPDEILFSNVFAGKEAAAHALTARVNLSDRKNILAEVSGKKPEYQLAWYDIKTYLTPMLLRQDKMGMRSGLENRVPFLDHMLVEAALALPLEERIAGGKNKVLLKRIAERYLPREVVYRTKVGFGQPIARWLRNPQGLGAYLVLLQEPPTVRPFFNYKTIRALIGEHLQGKDNSALLWTLLNMELWARIFIDNIQPQDLWKSPR